MCVCGCVLEVAAVGAAAAYVVKKFKKPNGKDDCACSCHKKGKSKDAGNTRKVKAEKKDEQQRL